MNEFDLNILYKNAKYFKKKIFPYNFILETKKGNIIITPTESDFSHLTGRQHSKNENIIRLKSKMYFEKALTKEIDITDVLESIDLDFFSSKQTLIFNKNMVS